MTDEQKAALAWLDGRATGSYGDDAHARTLKAMLAEPRLPEEVDIDCASQTAGLYHNEDHQNVAKDAIYAYHVKLRARLRKPQTKKVWHIVFLHKDGGGSYRRDGYRSKEAALNDAGLFLKDGHAICVEEIEVPA
jgi:hypothetical protein